MQTRCPHCQTVYSVDGQLVEELDARVRCGACMTLFNARDCLTADSLPAEALLDESSASPGRETIGAQTGGAQQPNAGAASIATDRADIGRAQDEDRATAIAAEPGAVRSPRDGHDRTPRVSKSVPQAEVEPLPAAVDDGRPLAVETTTIAEPAGEVFEVDGDELSAPGSTQRGEWSRDAGDIADMTAEIDWPQLDLPDPEFSRGNYGAPAPKAQVPLPAAAEPDALEAIKERAAAAVEEISGVHRMLEGGPATAEPVDGAAPAVPAGTDQTGSETPAGSDARAAEPESEQPAAPRQAEAPAQPAGPRRAADAPPAVDSGESAADARVRADPDLHDLLLNEELAAEGATTRRGGWLWALGALLLFLAILVQALYWQRQALAENPATRGVVAAMCGVLGCELEALRDVGRIELLQRSVYSHPNASGALIISVSMVNNAAFAQPYPTLAIRMANVRGRTVAARDFAADDYLKPDEGGDSMPVGAPVTITLEVIDPGRDALTFELDFL